MNRRQVLVTAAASLTLLRGSTSSSAAPKLPRPMVEKSELAPGLRLDYYHVVPNASGSWGIFGEYENLGDSAFDAPWMLVRFADGGGNTLFQEYASSVRSMIRPGEASVFHTSVYEPSRVEGWTEFSVSMCRDGWGRTEATEQVTDVVLENVKVKIEGEMSGRLEGYVDVKNTGTSQCLLPALYVISRNEKGRATFIEHVSVDAPIEPGTFARTDVWARLYKAGSEYELMPVAGASRGIFC